MQPRTPRNDVLSAVTELAARQSVLKCTAHPAANSPVLRACAAGLKSIDALANLAL